MSAVVLNCFIFARGSYLYMFFPFTYFWGIMKILWYVFRRGGCKTICGRTGFCNHFLILIMGVLLFSSCQSPRSSVLADGSAPVAKTELTSADLRHGEAQVRAMLQDRVNMNAFLNQNGKWVYVSPDTVIWKWAARRFAGEKLGVRIYWCSDPPMGRFLADHAKPRDGIVADVRLRSTYPDEEVWDELRGSDIPFEELWSLVVFELLNIESAPESTELYNSVFNGSLGKDAYVMGCAKLEHGASLKLKKFYRDEWLPWVNAVRLESYPRYWRLDEPENFDEMIGPYKEQKDNWPEVPYGVWYDKYVSHKQQGTNLVSTPKNAPSSP